MMAWVRVAVVVAGLFSAGGRQGTATAVQVDGAQIFRDVETLAADDMEGRLVGSPGGRKAREYVLRRLKQAGVAAAGAGFERPFDFTTRGGEHRQGTNLVGIIRGTRDSAHYIVVTAHYDHIGVRGGEVFNGADDNASGVAALLALAAHFASHPPGHSLLIAALDGEEGGLQGAKALMRDPPVPIREMVIDVNMDMVGRDPGNRLFAAGLHQYPFLRPYLESVAQPPVVLAFGHDTPGHKAEDHEQDWTEDSDHYVFHQAGIPFVYFGVEDFDQHHKATDDSATIGREFLAGAAATVIAAVHQFDAHLEQIAAERSGK
jgi:Zn-dependent M28 family amino/carboxypeptidase